MENNYLTQHIDWLRFDRPKVSYVDGDGEKLQTLAEGDGNLTMWGTEQMVWNEPLEEAFRIKRNRYTCVVGFKTYHAQLTGYGPIAEGVTDKEDWKKMWPIRGDLSLRDTNENRYRPFHVVYEGETESSLVQPVHNIVFDKPADTAFRRPPEGYSKCAYRIYGQLVLRPGLLIFEFIEDPGEVEVVCSYEWENRAAASIVPCSRL